MAFSLPSLPYALNALEPHFDARTMEIHHTKHHQAYIDKANAALEGTSFANASVEDVLRSLGDLPENIRAAVQNNAGGHSNHSLFWTILSPQGGGQPTGTLASKIGSELGGYEAFVESFTNAALTRFGSGWAWLVLDSQGKLAV